METEEITIESVEDLVLLINERPDDMILDIDLGKEDENGRYEEKPLSPNRK